MPEKVAEAVVARDVKMIFDPTTKEVVQVEMPFMSKTEVMTLKLDGGWVTEASVEDVKLLPGVHRVIFRLEGGRGWRGRLLDKFGPVGPDLWSTAVMLFGGETRDIRPPTVHTGSG